MFPQILDHLSIGMVLVDRCAKVLFANTAANELAAVERPFHSRGLFDAGTSMPKLEAFVRMALLGSVERAINLGPITGHDVVVLVSPLAGNSTWEAAVAGPKPAGLLILIDPHQSQRFAQRLLVDAFHLTQAEARVAVVASSGKSIGETAHLLDVSPNTVKTHLSRVYEKTGISRQAQLSRLVVAIGLGCGSPRTPPVQ